MKGNTYEMQMIQPIRVPDLREALIIQHVIMRKDDDTGEQSVEWRAGTVEKVSKGSNLQVPNSTGHKCCRKCGASKVR